MNANDAERAAKYRARRASDRALKQWCDKNYGVSRPSRGAIFAVLVLLLLAVVGGGYLMATLWGWILR